MGRRRQMVVTGARPQQGFEPPELRIGGVQLVGGVAMRAPGQARRGRAQFQPVEEPEEDEEALADYLANVLGANDGSDADSDAAFVAGVGQEVGETAGAFLDPEEDEDDSSSTSSSTSSSSYDGDEVEGSSSWRPASCTAQRTEVVQVVELADGTCQHVVQQLTQAQAFPYVMRDSDRPKLSHGKGGSAGKQRSVAKGALGGKLLPGEKKKLKREQKEAKRAARDARRGFDVRAAADSVWDFVVQQGDMLALDASGKHAQDVCLQLMRLAGLKATLQGSGKKRLVQGVWPEGGHSNRSQAGAALRQQLDAVMNAELDAQRKGAAAGAGVTSAGMAHATPLAAARAAACRSRRDSGVGASARRSSNRDSGSTHQPSSKPGSARAGRAGAGWSISFVSSGVVQDPGSASAPIILPPQSKLLANPASLQCGQRSVTLRSGEACQHGIIECAASTAGLGVEQQGATPASATVVSGTAGTEAGLRLDQPGPSGVPRGGGMADETGDRPVLGVTPLWDQLAMRFAQPASMQTDVDGQDPQAQRASDAEQPGSSPDDTNLRPSLTPSRGEHSASGSDEMQAASDAVQLEQQHQEEEEEEEEMMHTGLGYVDTGEHQYYRAGFALGLGALPSPSQYMAPQEPWHQTAPTPQDALAPGGQGSLHASTGASTPTRASGASTLASPRSHSRRGRVGKRDIHSYVLDSVLDHSPASLGLNESTQYSGEQAFNPNLTKKQAKAATKRAAKLARRAGATVQDDPGPVPSSSISYQFAGFERWTTGIGSRLMRGMGWSEGTGLGAARQGRAEPVMAHQRPKNLGLGADG